MPHVIRHIAIQSRIRSTQTQSCQLSICPQSGTHFCEVIRKHWLILETQEKTWQIFETISFESKFPYTQRQKQENNISSLSIIREAGVTMLEREGIGAGKSELAKTKGVPSETNPVFSNCYWMMPYLRTTKSLMPQSSITVNQILKKYNINILKLSNPAWAWGRVEWGLMWVLFDGGWESCFMLTLRWTSSLFTLTFIVPLPQLSDQTKTYYHWLDRFSKFTILRNHQQTNKHSTRSQVAL